MSEIVTWIIAIALVVIAVALVYAIYFVKPTITFTNEIASGNYSKVRPLADDLFNNVVLPGIEKKITSKLGSIMEDVKDLIPKDLLSPISQIGHSFAESTGEKLQGSLQPMMQQIKEAPQRDKLVQQVKNTFNELKQQIR